MIKLDDRSQTSYSNGFTSAFNMFRIEYSHVVLFFMLIHQIIATPSLRVPPLENVVPSEADDSTTKADFKPQSQKQSTGLPHTEPQLSDIHSFMSTVSKDELNTNKILNWDADKWIKLWETSVEKKLQNQVAAIQKTDSSLKIQDTLKTKTVSTSTPKEELEENNLDQNVKEWVKLWETSMEKNLKNQVAGTEKTDSPPLQDAQNTNTVSTSTLKEDLEESNSDQNIDDWAKLWETSVEIKTQNQFAGTQKTDAPLPNAEKTNTVSTSSPKEDLEKKNSGQNVDDWAKLWETSVEKKPQNEFAGTQKTDSPLPNAEKTITVSTSSPKEDLEKKDSGQNVDDWAKLWETSVEKKLQNEFAGTQKTDSPLPNAETTNTVSTSSPKENLEKKNSGQNVDEWIKLWETSVEKKPQNEFAGTQETDAPLPNAEKITDANLNMNLSSVQQDEETNAPSGAEPITNADFTEDLNTYHQSDTTISVPPSAEIREHTESLISAFKGFGGSTAELNTPPPKLTGSPQSLAKGERTEPSVTAESGNDFSSGTSKSTKSSTPAPKEIVLSQSMTQTKHTETAFDSPDRSKASTDNSRFELNDDMIVFIAIICCICVGLIIFLIFLIVCVCCKKPAKGFPSDTKNMTTLNPDGNRIDLQILRPGKASIDAFTFGLPVSTLEESLRTVVVEAPYLKY